MLRLAVAALLADPRIAQVRVALAAGDAWGPDALSGLPRTVWRHCGGPTRAATVLAALEEARLPDSDWVLVHDAARPGLPADALGRLIDTCLARVQGGLLAQPVADTVKQALPATSVAQDGQQVHATISREGLWLAQTPQMFPAGLLHKALLSGAGTGQPMTDEASAMEQIGYRPLLVTGSPRNFKLTWAQDFELMEKWL